MILKNCSITNLPDVLSWMSKVHTWEALDVSHNRIPSFCGDASCSLKCSRTTECYSSLGILQSWPDFRSLDIRTNKISGLCSTAVGQLWYILKEVVQVDALQTIIMKDADANLTSALLDVTDVKHFT